MGVKIQVIDYPPSCTDSTTKKQLHFHYGGLGGAFALHCMSEGNEEPLGYFFPTLQAALPSSHFVAFCKTGVLGPQVIGGISNDLLKK